MNLIRAVNVRYFRSVYNASLTGCLAVNAISGRNDVGKSNMLKALNLFFNGSTDWQTPLEFYRDFSATRLQQVRKHSIKGKQFISVTVEFTRPSSYKQSLPKVFSVTRTWHRDSKTPSQSHNLEALARGHKLPKTLETARRFLSLFVNRIHFEYVPAVKDRVYFTHLLARLQAALLDIPLDENNAVAGLAKQLSQNIEGQVELLQQDFKRSTGLDTVVAPPQELAALFQAFVVSTKSGDDTIPLALRGDGIQAKYVPSVLNYIAEKSRDFFIWGFEEPENSLEYTHAARLADDMTAIYGKNAQIFLTTHSPAFVAQREDGSSCFRAYSGSDGTKVSRVWPEPAQNHHERALRTELGFLDLQALVHAQYKRGLATIERLRDRIGALEDEIAESKTPLVLFEGKWDKLIVEEAWKKLRPSTPLPFILREVDPASGAVQGGGAGGADTLAKAIETIHPADGRKVLAIFDHDEEGIRRFQNLSSNFGVWKKKTGIKAHVNGVSFAALLPPPTARSSEAAAKNFYIEYFFEDTVLDRRTTAGHGLVMTDATVNSVQIGGKRLDLSAEQAAKVRAELKIDAYRRIQSGKDVFAEEIVPTLEAKDFENLELLFHLIDSVMQGA